MPKCPLCGGYVRKKGDICGLCSVKIDEGTLSPDQVSVPAAGGNKKEKRSKNIGSDNRPGSNPGLYSNTNTDYKPSDNNYADSADYLQTSDSDESFSSMINDKYSDHFSPQMSAMLSQNSNNTHDTQTQQTYRTQQTGRSMFGPSASGIARNITSTRDNMPFLFRWIRGMFTSHSFTFGSDITSFQIYRDYDGDLANTTTNISSQVIVYGTLPPGIIYENNNVEVWGRRNMSGSIVARRLRNSATGTTIRPTRVIPRIVQWFLTLLVVYLVYSLVVTAVNIVNAAFAVIFSPDVIADILTIVIIIAVVWFFFLRRRR